MIITITDQAHRIDQYVNALIKNNRSLDEHDIMRTAVYEGVVFLAIHYNNRDIDDITDYLYKTISSCVEGHMQAFTIYQSDLSEQYSTLTETFTGDYLDKTSRKRSVTITDGLYDVNSNDDNGNIIGCSDDAPREFTTNEEFDAVCDDMCDDIIDLLSAKIKPCYCNELADIAVEISNRVERVFGKVVDLNDCISVDIASRAIIIRKSSVFRDIMLGSFARAVPTSKGGQYATYSDRHRLNNKMPKYTTQRRSVLGAA